jgi:hypothetical protein
MVGRLDVEAVVGGHVADALDGGDHGVVGQRCILGNALCEFLGLGQSFALADEVVRQAQGLAFVGIQDAAGQHHLSHAAGADDARHSHRGATADIDAVAAFRQLVDGVGFGDPHVSRGRQFEATADHRAMQHGHHRDAGLVDLAEDAVPALRMHHHAGGLAVLVFGKVKAGAEMVAGTVQDYHAGFGRARLPGPFQRVKEAVADGIALRRAAQRDGIDEAVEAVSYEFVGHCGFR